MSFRAVRILYNCLLPMAFLLAAPGYLIKMVKRGNYGPNFGQRFGFYSKAARARLLTEQRPIWVHAVSVGETLVAHKLIRELRAQAPDIPIVLSSTTSTGHQLAHKHAAALGYTPIYNPLDFPPCVEAAFRLVCPRQIVLVEAEFWPNFLAAAKRDNVPVTLVNARLSPRSEARYRKFSPLTKPLFAQLDRVLVQAEPDITRWAELGVDRQKITCAGSIKFDYEGLPDPKAQVARLRQLLAKLRGGATGPVVLAGSTHPGEEKFIGEAFLELKKTVPNAYLVVVPRHFERADAVVRDLRSAGFAPVLKTRSADLDQRTGEPCLIVDTTGELQAWYHLADVVLIGKSFLADGGQNPVEPLIAGKPVIMGPNMQNFAPFVAKLVAAGGCIQLANPGELVAALQQLLEHPTRRAEIVANGLALLSPDQGSSRRVAALILDPPKSS